MRSATVRLVVIAILSLLFVIPLALVRGVVVDRARYQAEARAEIASSWSGPQTVAGPAIVLDAECDLPPTKEESVRRLSWREVLLPAELQLDGATTTERRARGIFETLLYRLELKFEGVFEIMPPQPASDDCVAARWTAAAVVFGVSDPRGIDKLRGTTNGSTELDWQPGTEIDGPWVRGASAAISPPPILAAYRLPFSGSLSLRGSDRLDLIPSGRETRAEIRGDWPSPSFQGAYLPTRRELGPGGFTSSWTISSLARAFPGSWRGAGVPAGVSEAAFGVELVLPLDGYQRTERALKYGLLVVVLTFLSFFLFELGGSRNLHPVQYALVGAALSVFYLLLLSVSEQLGFGPAYLAAATATVGLVSAYALAVLRAGRRALALGAILTALYAGLYALLVAEDLALLVGSVALFTVLALLMWRTRHVDWRRPLAGDAASPTAVSPGSGAANP